MPVTAPTLPGVTTLVDTPDDQASDSISLGNQFWPGQLPPPPPGATFAPDAPDPADIPSMGEMLQASIDNQILNQQSDSGDVALGNAYRRVMDKGRAAGLNISWNPVAEYQINYGQRDFNELLTTWHAEVQKQIDANPKLAEAMGPISREAIGEMANQLSRDAQSKYLDIKQRRGEGFWSLDTLAEFGVNMLASLNDPFQAGSLPIGGPSKSVAGAFVKGAAVNAGVEAALQPSIISRQVSIGNIGTWEEGLQQAGTNVLLAGSLGGLFEGGGKALAKGWGRVFPRADADPGGLQSPPEMPSSFDDARTGLRALSQVVAETDPEAAAIIRKAEYDLERDFETARQAPEGIERDAFVDAIEQADAKLRGLTEILERPEPRRPDPPAERLDTSDDAPTPKIGEQLTEDGRPVTFTSFDPRKLGVAPDEFQYKKFNGTEGVNGAIADVETWHAPSSGKILVFERANGELVVADGHQRRSKALGLMQAQGRDDIKLDGYLYREADGWTVADMRLKGAQKNIREGRSDVLDTAQALRESPNAIDSSFPVSRSNIRQARQLARLSDEAWDLTRAGVLEPQYAALIGAVAPDRPGIHAPLARTLIEAAPDNIRQAENIVSEALLDYAERSVDTQASLFGDDNLGRAVMYKERAQIMDAAYSWLRSERSVFKALVDKGDIARAIGNELVDAMNLQAKDQVELAIAAVMHSRKAGVRTAVTDMITRALDSVRREGVTPTRAGQQVAREIRALVEERGFRALLDAEGPRPPEPVDNMPLFDGPGSQAHVEHADLLEGDLHPEGTEDPGIKLEDALKGPDEVTSLVDELKNAGQGAGDRTPDQILEEIRTLISPKKEAKGKGKAKPVDPVEEAQAKAKEIADAESQLRDMLVGLTDAQKVSLVKMQYPDAYAWVNRLEGQELDDAIVGRVMAGDVKFARQGDILVLDAGQRVFSPGQPDNLGFITSAEKALANPPARFRDAKALTAEQWRKLMREGGASKEAFTYQIEPALEALADEGLTGDIPKAKFEEALARNRTTLEGNTSKGDPIEGVLGEAPTVNRDYSAYIAPGKATNYRQEVIALPGLDYRSHNWGTRGAVGHNRTTDRITADGEKSRHVEEMQSDIHQEGAKYGYRGQGPSEKAQSAQIIAEYDAAMDRYQKWYDQNIKDTVAAEDEAGPPPARWLRDYGSDRSLELISDPVGKELWRTALAKQKALQSVVPDMGRPPSAPMESWEAPFVLHNLQQAARDGIDLVTFATHATLHQALQNEGTKKFYDQRLPNTLARVAKSLGLKVEAVEMDLPVSVRVTETPSGWRVEYEEEVGYGNWEVNGTYPTRDVAEAAIDAYHLPRGGKQSVPAIRLTPAAKAKLAQGVVMYARGEWRNGMSPEGVVSRLKSEFGDGATALLRVGELNITSKPPRWVPPDTKGLTDGQGRVTLFSQNMDPAEVRGLVLHEVGVHAGLENVLGVAGKALLLNDIVSRMRAAAPDHALLRLTGVDPAPSRAASAVQFEPIANAAARDLVDLSPDQWADVIADNKYAAYLLPDGSEEAKLPRGYEMVRSGEANYAVRADHLRDREAAGARVTLLSSDDKAIVAAMNRVPLDTDPAHIAEETLAYLVQHAPKSGIVQRLLSDIRAWLYKTFPKLQEWMTLTDADLVSLAMGAVRQRVREANRDVSYASAKGGAVFSTTGVRYARGARNGSGSSQETGGTAVSGRAGGPANADARGSAGRGKKDAGSRNVRASAGPARAVVTEQIPALPPSGRRRWWNEQLELSPEQRAERKAQFRDVVDSVEFDVETYRDQGDFKFKSGRRTGDRGAFEHLTYTLRSQDNMHESWVKAFDPDTSRLEVEIHGSEATVPYSRLADEFQSTGLGTKLYAKMIDDLLARGLIVNSDVSVSEGAMALWKSLRKRGYDVVQRVPDPLLERGTDKQFSSRDNMTAIFYVARKKPPPPDLPFSDRDLSNKIKEARDLAEHIPSCIKGK